MTADKVSRAIARGIGTVLAALGGVILIGQGWPPTGLGFLIGMAVLAPGALLFQWADRRPAPKASD